METNLIKIASKQILSEQLGSDEGKIYYLILNGKEAEINKEFSYTKKYRIFRTLFKLGAMGKIKPPQKDYFIYFILPPIFIKENEEKEIKKFLENVYIKNYKTKLSYDFFQLIVKNRFDNFVKFFKDKGMIDEKIDFAFSEIRTKEGVEFIGHVERV